MVMVMLMAMVMGDMLEAAAPEVATTVAEVAMVKVVVKWREAKTEVTATEVTTKEEVTTEVTAKKVTTLTGQQTVRWDMERMAAVVQQVMRRIIMPTKEIMPGTK
jgi:hypothetical protein